MFKQFLQKNIFGKYNKGLPQLSSHGFSLRIERLASSKRSASRGFTLVETLVAIFIILIATTGPMVFAQSTLRNAYISRDQLTASFLAQDGIEAVKHIRDEHLLENIDGDATVHEDWLNFLDECDNGAWCRIDTVNIGRRGDNREFNSNVIVTLCPNRGCAPLRFNSTTGRYSYNSGQTSKFTRSISVEKRDNDREAHVIVEVKWDTVFGERSVVAHEAIFEWVPKSLLDY